MYEYSITFVHCQLLLIKCMFVFFFLFLFVFATFHGEITISKIGPTVRPGRRIEKKGQNRTVKNVTKALYFTYLGRSPTEPIFTKFCTVVAISDLITCANFWAEIFRGYDFTGRRISRFPIDSFMGLTTVQRYCAACNSLFTLPTWTRQNYCLVSSCPCRRCEHNWRQDKTVLYCLDPVLTSLVSTRPSFQFAPV